MIYSPLNQTASVSIQPASETSDESADDDDEREGDEQALLGEAQLV
jgi:hypothetical protein